MHLATINQPAAQIQTPIGLWRMLALAFSLLLGGIISIKGESLTPNLNELRLEALQLLKESEENNPRVFKLIQERNDIAAQNFLNDPLADLDLSRIVGRPYSDYDPRAWAFASVGYALFNAALCYVSPTSQWYQSPELLAKCEAGFEWMLRHVSEKGTLGAPDRNIDRFAYCPSWEAFVLLGDKLPPALQKRYAQHLLRAAEYQMSSYGRSFGRYPNMDAAYMLIMQQAASLFGRADFAQGVDTNLEQLARCMSGTTWFYIRNELAKWNPTPGYTQIVLQYLGRTWQLGKNPKALQQIQKHADYYRYYIEPSGLMDNGSAPHIKHDWVAPWVASVLGLELAHRYTEPSSPVLQTFVDRAHAALSDSKNKLHTRWMIYWIAPDAKQRESAPTNFARRAPEIVGFQARTTNEAGTLTIYATGRESACDTRLSAIVSSSEAQKMDHAALAGVFVEYVKDGTSYFMGEMRPRVLIEAAPEKQIAQMTVIQNRHSMGPNAKPLLFGNFMGNIKTWTQDCWRGGIPNTNPITNTESWEWDVDHLRGTISVKALSDTSFDEVRITLPFLNKRIDEVTTGIGRAAARSGHLCVEIAGQEGAWEVANPSLLKESGQLVLVSRASKDGPLPAHTILSARITIRLGQSLSLIQPKL